MSLNHVFLIKKKKNYHYIGKLLIRFSPILVLFYSLWSPDLSILHPYFCKSLLKDNLRNYLIKLKSKLNLIFRDTL